MVSELLLDSEFSGTGLPHTLKGTTEFGSHKKSQHTKIFRRVLIQSHGSLLKTTPPDVVLNSAIESNNVSNSIFLPINFHKKSLVSAYFVLYFDVTPVFQEGEARRKVAISIDGQLLSITRLPEFGRSVTVSIFPVNVTGGTANLTISTAEGTTSLALLNSMEVFSVIHISKAASSVHTVLATFFSLLFCFLWIS